MIHPLEHGWAQGDAVLMAQGVQAWKEVQNFAKGLDQGDQFKSEIYFRFGAVAERACARFLEPQQVRGELLSFTRLENKPGVPDFEVIHADGTAVYWDAKTQVYENFPVELKGSAGGKAEGAWFRKYPAGTKVFVVTFYQCWRGSGNGQPRVFVIDLDALRALPLEQRRV